MQLWGFHNSLVFVVVSYNVCLEAICVYMEICSILWVFRKQCSDPGVRICFVCVSVVWHVVIFKVFVCMDVGGQERQPWKAKFSWVVPLLPVVEKAGFPPAAFQKENFFFSFFLHFSLSQLPLAIQHVGILGQSVRQAFSRTSSSEQSQQGQLLPPPLWNASYKVAWIFTCVSVSCRGNQDYWFGLHLQFPH